MYRADVRNVVILLGACLVLWAPRLRGPIDLRYDAGVYYILGTSLAEGKGYRLLNEPGEIEAIQYPPLLPAMVALHERALGTSDPGVVGQVLRWSFFAFFTLFILAAYVMAREYLTPNYALLVGLVPALYVQNIFLSDLLFAEIPFGLVTSLFVICNKRSSRKPFFVLTALLGAAAYLLRTAGAALLGAWVVESLAQKRWGQAALRTLLFLVPIIGWQAYISHVTSSPEYEHPAYAYQRAPYQYYNVSYRENVLLVDPFVPELGRASPADLRQRVLNNLAVMPTSLGDGVTGGARLWLWLARRAGESTGMAWPADWVATLPVTIVGWLIVAGAVLALCRREWLIPAYIAASVALMSLTPWPGQFARYLSPVSPFLALCLVQLLAALRECALGYGSKTWQRAAGVFAALVMFGVFASELAMDAHAYTVRHEKGEVHAGPADRLRGRLFYYEETWAAFDAALEWLKAKAQPGDVVATSAPHWAYLKTDLKAVMPPMEADLEAAQRMLDAVPVNYVILDEMNFVDITRRYAGPVLKSHPGLWERVYSPAENRTRIYRRLK